MFILVFGFNLPSNVMEYQPPAKTPRQMNKNLPPQLPPNRPAFLNNMIPKKPASNLERRIVGRKLSADYNSNPVRGDITPRNYERPVQEPPLFRVPSAGGMRKPLGDIRPNYF